MNLGLSLRVLIQTFRGSRGKRERLCRRTEQSRSLFVWTLACLLVSARLMRVLSATPGAQGAYDIGT